MMRGERIDKKMEGAAVALLFQSNWFVWMLIRFRALEGPHLSIRLALDSCKAR